MTFNMVISIILNMKKFVLTSLFLFAICVNYAAMSANTLTIKAENLVDVYSHTSQYARIEGEISHCEVTDKSKVIFLNFGRNFNTSLSAVIYNTDIPAFVEAGINEPDKYFANKKVVLEGIVRISDGKPEVIINTPSQIKIINE